MLSCLGLIKNKKGQAIVELAIILPFLLLLIIGMVDCGRVMNAYLVTTNASREGARQASVGKNDTEVIASIQNAADSLDTPRLQITIMPQASERTRGTEVRISVSYPVEIITPLIGQIISNPYMIQTSTSMRVE